MSERTNKGYGSPLQDNGNKPVQSGAYPVLKDIVTIGNLKASAKKCENSVRWKSSVQTFEIDEMQWVAELYTQLLNGTYRSKGFREFWLMERGKKRFIQSVHISERCVQKCLNEYGFKPGILPRLIYDNGASVKGKGTEFAIKRLRQHLATHYRKHGRSGGILICDIHDYFGSIPHDKLLPMMRYAIRDDDLYRYAEYFINQFGDKGLGLGSEISQIAAIYYLNGLDHYIKEQLHIKGYARYMDDFYLIHEDTKYLKQCLIQIEGIIKELGLKLNPKTQIIRFDRGSFIYLKRRFFISKTGKIVTRLTRDNITKRRRVLKKQAKKNVNAEPSYLSWRSYATKWDTYQTVRNMDVLYEERFGGRPWKKK